MEGCMISIKQVAELAGVSIATVSRYINNPEQVKRDTRERVKAAIEKTGYSPNSLARNFRRGKSGIIFVVLPSVGDPFFSGVMSGIYTVANQQQYSILVKETRLNTLTVDEYSKIIFSKQADGLILLASVCPFNTRLDCSEQYKQPPIVISCESVSPELDHFPSVRIDNMFAAIQATEYLIDLGHRNIAFINGDSHSTLTADRERGFRHAMHTAGIAVSKHQIIEGGLTLEGAIIATRQLLSCEKPPTAIFCANDEMAIGAIHEIKMAGLKVPEDISVMGFDNTRYAHVADPPLSTIAQPAELIGKRTMQRLCKAIEGNDIGLQADIVPHQLIIRQSTAPPNSQADVDA